MNESGKIELLLCMLCIAGAYSKQESGNYIDSESISEEYFRLINGEPIYLNQSHCLKEISAEVISSNIFGFYNKSLYYIKIMWSSENFMMSIKVESDSLNDSYCEAENKHYYNRKPLNQSIHIFPDDVNEGIRFLPIKLDCKYIITPELEGLCKTVKFKYSTPVCIDNETCSCRGVVIPAPNLVANLDGDGLNILWSFPENFRNSIANIVISIYQEDGINIKKIARRRLFAQNFEPAVGLQHKEHFEVNVTNGYRYRIQGYFDNAINCHGNSTFLLFQYPGLIENIKNETLVPAAMALTFFSLFFLMSLLFFCKKEIKRICVKLFQPVQPELPNVEFYGDNYHQKTFPLPEMVYNTSYLEQNRDSYWFDYRDMVIVREIGNGNFGVVFLATSSKNIKGRHEFAVKQLKNKAGPEELSDFIEEINTFKLVGSHPNVVKMFGYCGAPYPLTIIMEYVPYNLLKYLKNLRVKFERRKAQMERSINYAQLSHSRSSSTLNYDYISQCEFIPLRETSLCSGKDQNELEYVLDNKDLEIFGLQIARGMAHLESRALVHRDLAARNVLMDAYKNLKISDFGMSRTGIYVNKSTRKFPLRWMSPEALINRTYSNKSDVWAFGVVLWEIGTLGAFPYSSLQNEEVINLLKKGGHLEKPENVTDELYDVMKNCWARLPEDRPTFKDLVVKLEKFCQKANGYVDFESLKSNYVFPPVEEDLSKAEKNSE